MKNTEKLSFGYMYDKLESLSKKKVAKVLTDNEILDFAKELREMETAYIPSLKERAGIKPEDLSEAFSVDDWVNEIKRPGSFRAIMHWLEDEDYDITMTARVNNH